VPGLLRRGSSEVEPREISDRLDRPFDAWTHLLPFRMLEPLGLPRILERGFEGESQIRVDEYRDGDVRAGIPGVGVEKDVEMTVTDGILKVGVHVPQGMPPTRIPIESA
jgi:hypothetical protein